MDSRCSYCNRRILYAQFDRIPNQSVFFCSIECAVLAGRFSVRKGWINQGKPVKTGTPKVPWYVPEDEREEYIRKVQGE